MNNGKNTDDQPAAAPARLVLPVASVREALGFYERGLGWRLLWLDAAERAALLQMTAEPGDIALLLAADADSGKQPEDATWPAAAQAAQRLIAGASFYIGVPAVADIAGHLRGQGIACVDDEDPGFLRKLLVPTPEGYTAVYWEELFPPDDELLDMYARGAAELQEALAGLPNSVLTRPEAPGKWSIAAHVLHVVDLELVAVHKLKFALAESGRAYTGNAFSPDDWSAGLDYGSRSPQAELRLLGALRDHVLGLCRSLPGALQRTVVSAGRVETAAGLLKAMAGHSAHHLRAIRRIRAGLDRQPDSDSGLDG